MKYFSVNIQNNKSAQTVVFTLIKVIWRLKVSNILLKQRQKFGNKGVSMVPLSIDFNFCNKSRSVIAPWQEDILVPNAPH